MSTASPSTDFVQPAASRTVTAAAAARDPRLDFFRGLGMFIILVAHIPYNGWANWIPARFGFSDATEIFVFCSGMASAIAFGGAFVRKGWLMGTARVLFRCWQVYWAHICLFFAVAMMMAALDHSGAFEKSYIDDLNLRFFFDDPITQIIGMFTLTYVPNYFDILPMYLVVLAMMPLVMALARISFGAAAAFCIVVWLAANVGSLSLPAEPWSDREWFFNPFGWQLLFFTGFAFMRGWLPAPPVSRRLFWFAVAFVVLSAPVGSWTVFQWLKEGVPALGGLAQLGWDGIKGLDEATGFDLRDKTDFALLRYAHFLALAYIAFALAGEGGWRLSAMSEGRNGSAAQFLCTVISKVGQQSLAVFVASMAMARLLGFGLDQMGRSVGTFALVNLLGFVLIVCVAYTAAWFKSQPWRSKRK